MEKIIEYLKNNKATAKEIAKELDMPVKKVKDFLKDKGIKKDKNYQYSLIGDYQIFVKGDNDKTWLLVENSFRSEKEALLFAKGNFNFPDGDYTLFIVKIKQTKKLSITRQISREFSG